MKKRKKQLIALLACLLWGMAGMAHAHTTGVTFQVTDNPGSWFECTTSDSKALDSLFSPPATAPANAECVHNVLGELTVGKSLAVIQLGESITFQSHARHGGSTANTIHTVVSLIYPTPPPLPSGSTFPAGFTEMPFDTDLVVGATSAPIVPKELGLHVFFCDIHPYMFAAVIVVDPAKDLFPLDLGKTVDLHKIVAETLPGLPTASDLALRLVHTFFIITNPHNWQNYVSDKTVDWTPAYPGVPVVAYLSNKTSPGAVNLDKLLRGYFSEGGIYLDDKTYPTKTLSVSKPPVVPGVGEVWVDTQFEMMSEKNKPGTVTAVDANKFKVTKKVGLPTHGTHEHDGMNNPHNMWTDKDQKVIYQTEWFDHYLSVFDRKTGAFVNRIETGLAPAHVMTRTNNDQVHVSQNGDNNVREFDSLAHGNGFLKDIPMVHTKDPITGEPDSAHPHAHWMSHDGDLMVSPNPDTENSTVYNFNSHHGTTAPVGHFPIATGMMPDSRKYYVANFLDSSITVMGIANSKPYFIKTINLLEGYVDAKVNFAFDLYNGDNLFIDGAAVHAPKGGLPIQIPVSPDGKYAIVANTMAAKILVIDTHTDTVVASLPCDAGCHGVQFGAKLHGGYYAYVSNKFSNRMIVVDLDGTAKGDWTIGCNQNPLLPCIAGSVLLTASDKTESDGKVSAYAGMGGQGVLPLPLVYNGWVQHRPSSDQPGRWWDLLTSQQKNPYPGHDDHR